MQHFMNKKPSVPPANGAVKLVRDERGVTIAEYGALLVLVIVAMVGALGIFKGKLEGALQKGGAAINGENAGSATNNASPPARGWAE